MCREENERGVFEKKRLALLPFCAIFLSDDTPSARENSAIDMFRVKPLMNRNKSGDRVNKARSYARSKTKNSVFRSGVFGGFFRSKNPDRKTPFFVFDLRFRSRIRSGLKPFVLYEIPGKLETKSGFLFVSHLRRTYLNVLGYQSHLLQRSLPCIEISPLF